MSSADREGRELSGSGPENLAIASTSTVYVVAVVLAEEGQLLLALLVVDLAARLDAGAQADVVGLPALEEVKVCVAQLRTCRVS